MELADYVLPVAIGSRVVSQTGVTSDGYKAGAFAAWVQSITGTLPTVVNLPGKRVKLVLTEAQNLTMQKWLDTQLAGALKKPSAPPSLSLEMGPVFGPWALKYAVPLAAAFVVIGWVGHYYLSR